MPTTVPIKQKTSLAAILVEQHAPLEIAEIELPKQLEYGQVLVEVKYSGLCGSQLGEIDGVKGPDRYLPHLLGHEGSGTVITCGPGVRQVKTDDTVVMHWRKGPGIESPTPTYHWQGKKINAGWITTFNRYAVVSENRLTAISDAIPLPIAALYGCAITTGIGAVSNNAQLTPGESAVILGAGGVGLASVIGARLSSAYPIVCCDLDDSKLQRAAQLGATHLFNASMAHYAQAVRDVIPYGADVVIETTGINQVMEFAIDLTSPAGRTILVGVPTQRGVRTAIDTLPLHFNKTITGSHGGECQPDYHIPRYTRLMEQHQIDLSTLISDSFSLADINDAIALMRSGKSARIIIEIE